MLPSIFERNSFDLCSRLFANSVRECEELEEVIFIELSIIISDDLHQAMFDQVPHDNLIAKWLCVDLILN